MATFALLAWLGVWQLERAAVKRERQALFDARMVESPVQLTGSVPGPETLLYRRVRARGQWIAEAQIFIDNRIRDGRAGFEVITPLRLEGRPEAVLVNRGWIARGPEYPAAPRVPVPQGVAEVGGLATLPPARVLELSSETVSGNVWQNLSISRYAQRMHLEVLPIVVLSGTPAPGLAVVGEKPDAGVAKHLEYALTWFALAITVAVLWIGLNVKRIR